MYLTKDMYLTEDRSRTQGDQSRARLAKRVAAPVNDDEEDEAEFCTFLSELNKAMA